MSFLWLVCFCGWFGSKIAIILKGLIFAVYGLFLLLWCSQVSCKD
nr:MAG TPA: hypothetical protein [Caudoviricetes sp.]